MAFRKRTNEQAIYATPEELHRNLPKGPDAVQNLWTHQSDVLRAYVDGNRDTPDVALELPTGTGKTLPGLLIAEWARRQHACHAIYACPTRQLAHQVHQVATSEGIDTALLVGRHLEWDSEASASFASARTIAITTYSSIFNTNPRLLQPQVLLFDDAHTGEQYVAGAYSLQIDRHEAEEAYQAVLTATSVVLDGVYLERLRDPASMLSPENDIRVVVPAQDLRIQQDLDSTLNDILIGNNRFQFRMIRDGLASCLVFLGPKSILIRPLIPPTHQNHLFRDARQRIYLSATLGQGGELERAFGREQIARISPPASSPTPRSGRRLFVFADLVKDTDGDALCSQIVSATGKALLLTPDRATGDRLSNLLDNEGWPRFSNDDVETSLDTFKKQEHGIFALANRYDGIDFPEDSCRLVVLEGLPNNTTLMEAFMSGRARAGLALAERVRTRVAQAAGRCTRGPSDFAVVVIRGADLMKYLLLPDTQKVLDTEVQAEIEFGRDNSMLTCVEVVENVESFLQRDKVWFEDAEPDIIERRQAAVRVQAPGAQVLSLAAASEVDACSEAWAGRWQEASTKLELAAKQIGQGGDKTRGYRAVLLYLSGAWARNAAAIGDDHALDARAAELVRQAENAARPAQWVKLMAPILAESPLAAEPEDEIAARAIVSMLQSRDSTAYRKRIERMVDYLSQVKATDFETGLNELGIFLGADASKPSPKGRCDSVWCWNNTRWVAIEAKREQEPNGLIPHRDIRQINDQLRLLQNDRSASQIPPGSATVLISPRTNLEPDAMGAAEDHTFLTTPGEVLAIANAVAMAWNTLSRPSEAVGRPARRRHILKHFRDHGVLPSLVADKLTLRPIG